MKTAPAPEGARHQTRSQYSTPASYADRLEAIRAALLE
ncbi:MAG: topoisomerase, partial [Ignavibacteriae bacterium]|nr:topoisomerase [Ignavibacteriota bacterium]